MSLEPSRDIGFQNVLQNGLAIMRGQIDNEAVRDHAFGALIEIFSEADRGSHRLGMQNLAVNARDRLALERFTVFFRYLTDVYGADLAERLSETTALLRRMRNADAVDDESKNRAATLMASFLDALQRDRALKPLQAPKMVQYG